MLAKRQARRQFAQLANTRKHGTKSSPKIGKTKFRLKKKYRRYNPSV
jgi:hypothetical protein